jgi:hypothetical protein
MTSLFAKYVEEADPDDRTGALREVREAVRNRTRFGVGRPSHEDSAAGTNAAVAPSFAERVRAAVRDLAEQVGVRQLAECPDECRVVVNEAFVRTCAGKRLSRRQQRRFFVMAAEAVEEFIRSQAARLQESLQTTFRDGDRTVRMSKEDECLARHEALRQLAETSRTAAMIHRLRIYGGRTFEEIAFLLDGIGAKRIRREAEIAEVELIVQERSFARSQQMLVRIGE